MTGKMALPPENIVVFKSPPHCAKKECMKATFKHPKKKGFAVTVAAVLGVGALLFPRPTPTENPMPSAQWGQKGQELAASEGLKVQPKCRLASRTVKLPAETPLGGYLFPRSAKAPGEMKLGILLLGEAPHQVAVLSAEVLMIPPHFARSIRAAFHAQGISETLFTATHTHSGPGGFGETVLEKLVLGAEEHVPQRLIGAALELLQAVRRQPAAAFATNSIRTDFLRRRTASNEPLDDRLSIFGCGPKRLWIMHAAHPVTETDMNLMSGDWPQLFTQELKARGLQEVLYASSSGGEVSLEQANDLLATVQRMANRVMSGVNNMKPVASALHFKTIHLPVPELTVPIHPDWVLTGPGTRMLLPQFKKTRVEVLHHEDWDWFFLPYESSSVLWTPNALPELGQREIFHSPFNGEYLGYVLPAIRHGRPGAEQALSLLGPWAASRHLAFLKAYLSESSSEAFQTDAGTSPE